MQAPLRPEAVSPGQRASMCWIEVTVLVRFMTDIGMVLARQYQMRVSDKLAECHLLAFLIAFLIPRPAGSLASALADVALRRGTHAIGVGSSDGHYIGLRIITRGREHKRARPACVWRAPARIV